MSNTTLTETPKGIRSESDQAFDKLVRKSKETPFVPIGILGTVGAVLYGAYAYKNRNPAMSTSRYVMRLRVVAQSVVVGAMIVGAVASTTKKRKD